MTDIDTRAETSSPDDSGFAADRVQNNTLGEAVHAYLGRVRGGDMGALPAVLGLVVLFIVFGLANDRFLSALNMANLITQAGAIIVLAMGLVLILLLGDIDLSAGVAGGVAACVMGLLLAKHDQPWYVAILGAVLTGAVIGFVIGLLVAKLGIPSFVVTLAFFLGLQGVTLKLIGQGGSVRVNDPVVAGITKSTLSVTAGWILAVVAIVVFAVVSLLNHRRKVAENLQRSPLVIVLLQIAALAVVLLVVTYVLNINRAPNPGFVIEGIPYVLPVVVVLLIFWTFILGRTAYGRHVFAVGGNPEAARRAGINVDRIRISVFVFGSSMAGLSGIIAASNLGKVSTSSGGGNTLLYAVGAAVIGGTSLFGGKGKAVHAVIGGLVIATIANGLGLLNQSAYINFIVTGAVLLLAASVDAVSRRRRSASGV